MWSLKKFFENLNKEPEYEFLLKLPKKEYPKYLKKIFWCRMHEKLNLEHPKKFSEKIQWLKLYDNLPIKSELADKIKVRDYVKEKIGEKYLKPLIGTWDKAEEIDFDKLPEEFILKPNNASGFFRIVNKNDKFFYNSILKEKLLKDVNSWLLYKFAFCAGFELQYLTIKPKILAEEIIDSRLHIQTYCFDGKPTYVSIYTVDEKYNMYHNLYDTNYNLLPYITTYEHFNMVPLSLKTDFFKEAVELSRKLSQGFKLVRVDFIETKNKDRIYFEEMTFTPISGFVKFSNPLYDTVWGKQLKLPADK